MSDIRLYDQLAARFEEFLDANYPCRCGDARCPGSYYESRELVRIVRLSIERQLLDLR